MKFMFLLLLPLMIFAAPDAKMRITKDVDQRASISIVDGSADNKLSRKLHSIIVSDLKISGHFKPDKEYRVDKYSSNSVPPKLRAKEYLLKFRFTRDGDGAILETRLLKASNSKEVFAKKYLISSLIKYSFVAHRAISDINDKLGYKSIKWINRYVIFTRYTGRKQSEILLADYTFHYTKSIIKGGLNLFPQWADPKQNAFYYTSYEGGKPTLFKLNIYTGKKSRIISSSGMLICSDVSRDGSKVLLTMAPNNQPDIYELTIATRKAKRLTKFSGIDVNGKYSDGEKSITFVSNRMGRPNIYKKYMGKSAVMQEIFHGKKNNSCDTNGDRIVYSSKEGKNQFNVYLANTKTGSVRPLTSMGVNQFPRFAPDGETILYIKRKNGVNSIGYIGLQTNQAMLFPLGNRKIQSIDW